MSLSKNQNHFIIHFINYYKILIILNNNNNKIIYTITNPCQIQIHHYKKNQVKML